MSQPNPSHDARPPALSRRTVFVGASAAGAAVAAAAVLPAVVQEPVAAAAPSPSPTGGYQLTDHVRRYYQTAKV